MHKPHKVVQVKVENVTPIATIKCHQGAMIGILEDLSRHLQKLEASQLESTNASSGFNDPLRRTCIGPVFCRRCHKEGHYVQGVLCPATSS